LTSSLEEEGLWLLCSFVRHRAFYRPKGNTPFFSMPSMSNSLRNAKHLENIKEKYIMISISAAGFVGDRRTPLLGNHSFRF